jgi:hypothetical protein
VPGPRGRRVARGGTALRCGRCYSP